MEFQAFGARDGLPVVNWCGKSFKPELALIVSSEIGFYLDSCLFPPNSSHPSALQDDTSRILLLGPFCGKPACQYIKAKKGGGVCSDSYLARKSLVVPDVEAYPGHIACDGNTRSEIVLPMKLRRRNPDTAEDEEIVLGVMDLDSTVLSAFDDEDTKGLERIVQTVVLSCTW
jgi:L-methionine (R)-S-oxide reductase